AAVHYFGQSIAHKSMKMFLYGARGDQYTSVHSGLSLKQQELNLTMLQDSLHDNIHVLHTAKPGCLEHEPNNMCHYWLNFPLLKQ
ncbi:hypothetical protein GOP47_0029945, partial [Adiantum capillus-veneris]